MRYDALIIGAGMSGLAAAIRIAQAGRRVTLLERHSVWGGLNSFYTLEGRAFDVGLHALTNWAPGPAARSRAAPPDEAARPRAPLLRVLRALRIQHEELQLGEQGHSEILFPGVRLRFTNDFDVLESEVARLFPRSRDGFAAVARFVRAFEPSEDAPLDTSARAFLAEHLPDPLLAEVLLLPILYYGSAREDDVDLNQFAILFRALYLEGLCRPEGGIRTLLNLLVKRAKRAGVELRMACGVRRILLEDGVASGVELDSGETLEAGTILSSAGRVETRLLAGLPVEERDFGRLSFVESVWVLDRAPAELGYRAATSFFCHSERVRWRRPDELVDLDSGVVSSPNNFAAEKPLAEGWMRVSVLANHDRWCALAPDDYARAKERAAQGAAASAARFVPDWTARAVFRDVFTPRTIRAFTGHAGGAVYGSPRKSLDGASGIPNLVLVGTDQGYLGVVGALVSGVAMANRHVLVPLAR